MPTSLPDQAETEGEASALATRYSYKASLVGSACQFELTDAGLSWRVGSRSGVWPYADIASVRLSYRPMSMQPRRFRADIEKTGSGRISIFSTTWQTVTLMSPQDQDYRAFIVELHRRMQQSGSKAALLGGIGTMTYGAAVAIVGLLAVAMIGLIHDTNYATARPPNSPVRCFWLRSQSGSSGRSGASSGATGRAATPSTSCPMRCCHSAAAIRRNQT